MAHQTRPAVARESWAKKGGNIKAAVASVGSLVYWTPFLWDINHGIPGSGKLLPTFSRDSAQTFTDFEGLLKEMPDLTTDLPVFEGARMVRNLVTSIEVSSTGWGAYGAINHRTDVQTYLGNTYLRIDRENDSGHEGISIPDAMWTPQVGEQFRVHFDIVADATNPMTDFTYYFTGDATTETFTLSQTEQRFSTQVLTIQATTDDLNLYNTGTNDDAGDTCYIRNIMLEKVTGQTNQNPSEFVDGIQFFDYKNPNHVQFDGVVSQRANYIYTSEILSAAKGHGNVRCTVDETTSVTHPDGLQVSKFVASTDAGTSHYITLNSVAGYSNDVLQREHFYIDVKAGTLSWIDIEILVNGSAKRNYFDIGNLAWGTVNADTWMTLDFEELSDGWVRLKFIGFDDTVEYTSIRIRLAASNGDDGADTYNGTDEQFYLTRAFQVETFGQADNSDCSDTYVKTDEGFEIIATSGYEGEAIPLSTLVGYVGEKNITNKCENYNAAPDGLLTNITKTGDAACTLTEVDDSAELEAAGLLGLVPSGTVFKLDNSGGAVAGHATITGQTGNTNAHTASVWARGSTDETVGVINFSATAAAVSITGNTYARFATENVTPSSVFDQLRVTVNAGKILYFILNQLEECPNATSEIIVAGASATRSACKLELPLENIIRNNDFWVICVATPLHGTQGDGLAGQIWSAYIDGSNRFQLRWHSVNGAIYCSKQVGGSWYSAQANTGADVAAAGDTLVIATRFSSTQGVHIWTSLNGGAVTPGTSSSSNTSDVDITGGLGLFIGGTSGAATTNVKIAHFATYFEDAPDAVIEAEVERLAALVN